LAINGRLIAEPDKSSHNPTLQMGTAAKINAGAGQYSKACGNLGFPFWAGCDSHFGWNVLY